MLLDAEDLLLALVALAYVGASLRQNYLLKLLPDAAAYAVLLRPRALVPFPALEDGRLRWAALELADGFAPAQYARGYVAAAAAASALAYLSAALGQRVFAAAFALQSDVLRAVVGSRGLHMLYAEFPALTLSMAVLRARGVVGPRELFVWGFVAAGRQVCACAAHAGGVAANLLRLARALR